MYKADEPTLILCVIGKWIGFENTEPMVVYLSPRIVKSKSICISFSLLRVKCYDNKTRWVCIAIVKVSVMNLNV